MLRWTLPAVVVPVAATNDLREGICLTGRDAPRTLVLQGLGLRAAAARGFLWRGRPRTEG